MKAKYILFLLIVCVSCSGRQKSWETDVDEPSAVEESTFVYKEAQDSVHDEAQEEKAEPSATSRYKSSSHRRTSSYDWDDDDDEEDEDPEYRPGGKYDPELYHTDYGYDQEHLRRSYIDNDGYDENDNYDEYYGYGGH